MQNCNAGILIKVKLCHLLNHSERVIKRAYCLSRPMNRFKFIALKYASVIIIKDTTGKRNVIILVNGISFCFSLINSM